MAISDRSAISGRRERPSFALLKTIRIREMIDRHRGRKNGSANILQYGHMKSLAAISESILIKRPPPKKQRADFSIDRR